MLNTAEVPEEFDRRAGGRSPVLAVGHGRLLQSEPRPVFRVATTDVSRSGMMVTCPPWVNVRPGESIHLVFPAERREQTVDVSGRVVWKRSGGGDPAAAAIGDPAVPWRIGVALHHESLPEALRLLDL